MEETEAQETEALLERLGRIEALDREGAPPSTLLPELRALVREAEAWARREGDPDAEAAAASCAAALSSTASTRGDAIVRA
jgi:hypothetical protein